MYRDADIASAGIGMTIGARKFYYPNNSSNPVTISQHNIYKNGNQHTGLKRTDAFKLFTPIALSQAVKCIIKD
jgi:hypothetical protein